MRTIRRYWGKNPILNATLFWIGFYGLIYNRLGVYLDNGEMGRIVAAGQPLYMNVGWQPMIMIGAFMMTAWLILVVAADTEYRPEPIKID